MLGPLCCLALLGWFHSQCRYYFDILYVVFIEQNMYFLSFIVGFDLPDQPNVIESKSRQNNSTCICSSKLHTVDSTRIWLHHFPQYSLFDSIQATFCFFLTGPSSTSTSALFGFFLHSSQMKYSESASAGLGRQSGW